MIVVSNRVVVPDERADTFLDRLGEDHGIEDQPGFLGLHVLEPVDADTYVTMTYWESREDYEAWHDGESYDRAHAERSADEAFAEPNRVELHEVVVERDPA